MASNRSMSSEQLLTKIRRLRRLASTTRSQAEKRTALRAAERAALELSRRGVEAELRAAGRRH